MSGSRMIAKANRDLPAGVRYPIIYADPPWKFEVYSEDTGPALFAMTEATTPLGRQRYAAGVRR